MGWDLSGNSGGSDCDSGASVSSSGNKKRHPRKALVLTGHGAPLLSVQVVVEWKRVPKVVVL